MLKLHVIAVVFFVVVFVRCAAISVTLKILKVLSTYNRTAKILGIAAAYARMACIHIAMVKMNVVIAAVVRIKQ